MGTFEDENTADGHTILLIETELNSRTFSDYPNKLTCLETIVNMYEEENTANERQKLDGLTDFMKWLDSFYQIRLLVFDKEISRYRETDREGLKRMFEENPDGDTYGPTETCNGEVDANVVHTITLNGMATKDEDDSEEEDSHWDE